MTAEFLRLYLHTLGRCYSPLNLLKSLAIEYSEAQDAGLLPS